MDKGFSCNDEGECRYHNPDHHEVFDPTKNPKEVVNAGDGTNKALGNYQGTFQSFEVCPIGIFYLASWSVMIITASRHRRMWGEFI